MIIFEKKKVLKVGVGIRDDVKDLAIAHGTGYA